MAVGRCPRIRVKCLFRENNDCFSDRDCKAQEKCCLFSCGMKCVDPTEDPCDSIIKTKHCQHTLTRWYYSIKENECYPFEYNLCADNKNSFQSHDVCKRTCLAFGHGVPIHLFELEGEPFTVLV
uniref:Eppin-like isoform X2 n=1 Tax=Phascolarctos cinereus TaxID=38626 RepID=A0A6P5IAZ5_PHACI|nr:eppin-like isoform X2 [Phascolarctos cinereus]